MIQLFNVPKYKIDTSKFSSLLHDKVVTEFEQQFAEYVGAKYAVSVNSATNAIYLLMLLEKDNLIGIPSILPPVVANAIINAGKDICFFDNVSWVGDSYVLHKKSKYQIIDSAQKVKKNQYVDESKSDKDIMFFSFYPTKPVGSCDGGMIVSNNPEKIEKIRTLTFNGMSFAKNNWERVQTTIGHKMYMNSIQAYIASENLKKLEIKQQKLGEIREIYNKEFGLNNTSDHLYRVHVKDNSSTIKKAQEMGIMCGIHYHALHNNKVFKKAAWSGLLTNSQIEHTQAMSIPFHENLTKKEIATVTEFVKKVIIA
jgi:dTDP-4-amino-4,6-dideoxygalactose transaminase